MSRIYGLAYGGYSLENPWRPLSEAKLDRRRKADAAERDRLYRDRIKDRLLQQAVEAEARGEFIMAERLLSNAVEL